MKILFVCTGNTCRSPMAQAMAEFVLNSLGISAEVASGGIFAAQSSLASQNAVTAALQGFGLDISGHASRPVLMEDVVDSNVIIALTMGHKRHLLALYPEHGTKIFTIAELCAQNADVPDPYGGGLDVYADCARQIMTYIQNINWRDICDSTGL